MNERFLRKWSMKRTMGKKRYTIRFGLLGFGVSTILLFTLLEVITSKSIKYPYLAVRVVVLPLVGIWGLGLRWDSQEDKYLKLTSGPKQTNNDSDK